MKFQLLMVLALAAGGSGNQGSRSLKDYPEILCQFRDFLGKEQSLQDEVILFHQEIKRDSEPLFCSERSRGTLNSDLLRFFTKAGGDLKKKIYPITWFFSGYKCHQRPPHVMSDHAAYGILILAATASFVGFFSLVLPYLRSVRQEASRTKSVYHMTADHVDADDLKSSGSSTFVS